MSREDAGHYTERGQEREGPRGAVGQRKRPVSAMVVFVRTSKGRVTRYVGEERNEGGAGKDRKS